MFFSDNGQIKSNREVTYLGENAKIKAQGMDMNIDSDTMYLNGMLRFFKILVQRLIQKTYYISHGNAGEKKYKSKEKTSL